MKKKRSLVQKIAQCGKTGHCRPFDKAIVAVATGRCKSSKLSPQDVAPSINGDIEEAKRNHECRHGDNVGILALAFQRWTLSLWRQREKNNQV